MVRDLMWSLSEAGCSTTVKKTIRMEKDSLEARMATGFCDDGAETEDGDPGRPVGYEPRPKPLGQADQDDVSAGRVPADAPFRPTYRSLRRVLSGTIASGPRATA
jgi:hypothetical protein